LQGEYNHLNLEDRNDWNDAVFSLGSQLAFLDIRVESSSGMIVAATTTATTKNENEEDSAGTIHRLELELATTALPLAADNFLKLIKAKTKIDTNSNGVDVDNTNDDDDVYGYLGSTLHRIEKGVGILGGLVAKNPYSDPNASSFGPTTKTRIGRCHPDHLMETSFTAMDVTSEHFVLCHVPGVITMMQPRVNEIDSRFMILSHHAPHMDGVAGVAIGRVVTEESLRTIQTWENSLITSYGVPTNLTLRIVDCGLLEADETKYTHDVDNNHTENENIENHINKDDTVQKQVTIEQ